ncbi:MAG: bifunctional methylenetetrahydrofolate dehydrogenase/methenyltetrahydrofolate cyclohydrolase FolD [Thermaerobacter sp.]|nr:bifunctional methylenetetrahydrofolate dehydrogenase/methenyltetrahydrofolate cyclohydrolase FolD [Thermaerobacter sp.]
MGQAIVLDGKRVGAEIRQAVGREVEAYLSAHGRRPGLAVVLVGNDPASEIYVRNKRRACEDAHMHSVQRRLPETATTDDVVAVVRALNQDPQIHGILVQLPVPRHVDSRRVLAELSPDKDVDGLTETNLGRLAAGQAGLRPCTPMGVLAILDRYDIPLSGRRAVVVGRSRLVGLPLALLLMARDATVTVVHSRTADPVRVVRDAEIVAVAAGRPQMVTREWIRPGAAVVDVGINRTPQGLVGDVEAGVAEVAGYLTPVPGGVGPMTIAGLLRNTWQAFLAQEADRT